MRHEVTTVDDLRAIVGEPNMHVANKVKDRLSPVQQGLAGALAAGIRRDHRCSRPRRRVAEG